MCVMLCDDSCPTRNKSLKPKPRETLTFYFCSHTSNVMNLIMNKHLELNNTVTLILKVVRGSAALFILFNHFKTL